MTWCRIHNGDVRCVSHKEQPQPCPCCTCERSELIFTIPKNGDLVTGLVWEGGDCCVTYGGTTIWMGNQFPHILNLLPIGDHSLKVTGKIRNLECTFLYI